MDKLEFLKATEIVKDYYEKNTRADAFCSEMEAEYINRIWNDTIWDYLDYILKFKLSSILKNGCSDSYYIGFVEGFKQGQESLKVK